jgi:hypothetical protein
MVVTTEEAVMMMMMEMTIMEVAGAEVMQSSSFLCGTT